MQPTRRPFFSFSPTHLRRSDAGKPLTESTPVQAAAQNALAAQKAPAPIPLWWQAKVVRPVVPCPEGSFKDSFVRIDKLFETARTMMATGQGDLKELQAQAAALVKTDHEKFGVVADLIATLIDKQCKADANPFNILKIKADILAAIRMAKTDMIIRLEGFPYNEVADIITEACKDNDIGTFKEVWTTYGFRPDDAVISCEDFPLAEGVTTSVLVTPLGMACKKGCSPAFISELLTLGADPNYATNTLDVEGFKRPLVAPAWAVLLTAPIDKSRKIELLHLLLKNGANLLLKNGAGWWLKLCIFTEPEILLEALKHVTLEGNDTILLPDGTAFSPLDDLIERFDTKNSLPYKGGTPEKTMQKNWLNLIHMAALLIFRGIKLNRKKYLYAAETSTVKHPKFSLKKAGEIYESERKRFEADFKMTDASDIKPGLVSEFEANIPALKDFFPILLDCYAMPPEAALLQRCYEKVYGSDG